MERVINIHHPMIRGANFNDVAWTEKQAVCLYKLLVEMGATKDMEMVWHSTGNISISTKFPYPMWNEKDGEDGIFMGTQITPLGIYIRKLIRFDRSSYKKMKHVELKINAMARTIESVRKESTNEPTR